MLLAVSAHSHAQTINYGTAGSQYSQDFNGLNTDTNGDANPVSFAASTTTPVSLVDPAHFHSFSTTDSVAGWYGENYAGTSGNFLFGANTGASNAGAIYNFRTTTPPNAGNFALGSISSGGFVGQFGAVFTNTTGSTLTSITITYTGEQWRAGGNAAADINTLSFSYSVGATSIDSSSGTFINDTTLNYVDTVHGSPTNSAPVVLDGNLNQTTGITDTITGLTWTAGSTLVIRWTDVNDVGNDDGIAIDDLKFSAAGSGIAAQYWDPNGAAGIGGSGTWDTTSNFWNPQANASGVPTTFNSAANAVFGGTAGTVTIVSTGVTSNGGVEFATGGYIINGPGALTLGSATGGNSITVDNASDTATINAKISGSSGLLKAGAGNLILGSITSDFTGGVQIKNGTLTISDDRNLGDFSNDIVISNATLKTTAGITTTRNFSGNGTFNVASGAALLVDGNFNLTALTLSNSGTLDLEGGVSNVGAITFTAPGTLKSVSDIIVATGLNATNLVGKATIFVDPSEGLNLGTGTVTVDVGAGGDLVLATPISLATVQGSNGTSTNSLKKTGLGTLELTGDNADTVSLVRIQIGTAATGNGGTVIINNSHALGTNQLFFNFGTLQATTDLTGANAINTGVAGGNTPLGVSLGGLDNASTVFAGSNMEFDGPSSIFQSATVHSRITVNNTTILGGAITLAGTAPTAPAVNALTIDGTGTLVINGNASAMTLPTTVIASVTLSINSAFAGSVVVASPTAKLHVGASGTLSAATAINSGALSGTGTLAAVTIGDGVGTKDATLAPGETTSTGTLATSALSLNSDAVFALKLNTTTLANDFVTVSGQLTLTGTPTLSLSDLNPNGARLALGTQFAFIQYGTFGGGTFFDSNGNALPEGAMFAFGANEYQISYDGGSLSNEVLLTTVVVPEPSALAALVWGGTVLAGVGRFRRRARLGPRPLTKAPLTVSQARRNS